MDGTELRQRLESAGLLAETMAHEINTPLAAARDCLKFLRGSFLDLVEIAVGGDREDLEYLVTEVPRVLEEAIEAMDRVAAVVRTSKELASPDLAARVEDASIDCGAVKVRAVGDRALELSDGATVLRVPLTAPPVVEGVVEGAGERRAAPLEIPQRA